MAGTKKGKKKTKTVTDEPYDGTTPLKNLQHEALCNEYLIDYNGQEAGIRAGYAKRSARHTVSELLTKPNISARLAYLSEQKSKRAHRKADDIRKRVEDIAFTTMPDLVTFNESGATFIKNSDDIKPEHACAIEAIGFKEDNTGVSFKLKKINPMRALELLGKEEGMFVDRLEVSGSDDFANKLASALNRGKHGDSDSK
jgi:hypothetical protein